VTGNGGPSGTGKRPLGEPVLPPPVFIQDNITANTFAANTTSSQQSVTSAASGSTVGSNITKPAPISRSSTMSSWNTAAGIIREELNSITVTERDAYEYNNEDNSADSFGYQSGSGVTTSFNNNVITHQHIITKSNPVVPAVIIKEAPSIEVKPPLAPMPPIDRSIVQGGAYVPAAIPALQAPVTMTTANMLKLKEEQQQQPKFTAATITSIYADNDRSARQRSASDSSFADSISSDTTRKDRNFNGVCSSAVFPVPVSSLSITVWSAILQPIEGSSDLLINPYGHLMLPFSELLDLTIPPVDATGYSSWPKPLSYYRQGSLPNGSTHCIAGKHTHNRAPPPNANAGSYTSQHGKDQSPYDDHYNHNSTHNSGTHHGNNNHGNPYNTNYNMNHQQYTQQHSNSNINNSNNSNINGNTHMNQHHEHQVQQQHNTQQQQQTYTAVDDRNRTGSDTGNNNNNSARISALRQIFPTAKIGNAINSN